MQKFFKKSAQAEHELYFILFEILLATAVFFMLFNYINSFKDNTIYDKNFMARDLALILNTVYMAPGNLYYEYEYANKPISDFDYYFSSTSKTKDYFVSISDSAAKGSQYAYFVTYPYAKNKEIRDDLQILKSPSKIFFIKTGDMITNNKKLSLNRLNCPKSVLSKKPSKIFIDFIYKNEKEKELLSILDSAIKSDINLKLETHFSEKEPNWQMESTSSDILLIISLAGQKGDPSIKSRYLFNSETKYLSCYILNSLLDNSNTEFNIANIPVDKFAGIKPIKDTATVSLEINLPDFNRDQIYKLSKGLIEVIKNYES